MTGERWGKQASPEEEARQQKELVGEEKVREGVREQLAFMLYLEG